MNPDNPLHINISGNTDPDHLKNVLADAAYHHSKNELQAKIKRYSDAEAARTISINAEGMDAALFARLCTIITEEWPGATLGGGVNAGRAGAVRFRIPEETDTAVEPEPLLVDHTAPRADHQHESPWQRQHEPPKAVTTVTDRTGGTWSRNTLSPELWIKVSDLHRMRHTGGYHWEDLGGWGPFTWEGAE